MIRASIVLFFVLVLIGNSYYQQPRSELDTQTKVSLGLKKETTGLLQKNDFALSIVGSELKFKRGEKQMIRVTFTNITEQEIFFLQRIDEDDFKFEVWDEDDRITPISKAAKEKQRLPSASRELVLRLAPDEEYNFDLNFGSLYDLDVGTYKLALQRPFFGKDRQTIFLAKLKPVQISITP